MKELEIMELGATGHSALHVTPRASEFTDREVVVIGCEKGEWDGHKVILLKQQIVKLRDYLTAWLEEQGDVSNG